MNKKKYVFFDRDGTLIEKVHHLHRMQDVRLVENLSETLQTLSQRGYHFGIVTNQSVIGRGLATHAQVDEINDSIIRPLNSLGVNFDFVLICPHLPENGCICRKPRTGLIEKISEKSIIDFATSYMVGDEVSDMEFGKALNMNTIKISKINGNSEADHTVSKLSEIMNIIM